MAASENIVLDTLLAHRSIRRFSTEPVVEEDLRQAVAAGQQAATSSNIQGYCAIRIRDAKRLKRLVKLTGGQKKVAECGAFLVICGDTRRHRLLARRSGRPHVSNLEAFMLALIDASLFAQNMVVALESLGRRAVRRGQCQSVKFFPQRLDTRADIHLRIDVAAQSEEGGTHGSIF